jgi:hypothetical protein
LKHYIDDEFRGHLTQNGSSPSGIDTEPDSSDLEGRVIRLPYKLEKIAPLLEQYLNNLREGQQCEIKREGELDTSPTDRQIGKQIAYSRWHESGNGPYIGCEYINKVEKIIEEKIGWTELVMNRDYKLGCEIIVKSLLNSLPHEEERRKWLCRLKNYIPISPENLEVTVENQKVYPSFKLGPSQSSLYGDEALKFYKSLLDIYRKHPVFCNRVDLISIENGEEIIKQVCIYLSNVLKKPLEDYIIARKEKYQPDVKSIENLLQDHSSNNSDKLNQLLCGIERKVLGEITLRRSVLTR